MLKFTLISYLVLLVIMVFALNKFVDFKNQLEKKVLGSYYSQMEEINKATGLEVYNLEKREITREDLQVLEDLQ